jgi:hypothetical protein
MIICSKLCTSISIDSMSMYSYILIVINSLVFSINLIKLEKNRLQTTHKLIYSGIEGVLEVMYVSKKCLVYWGCMQIMLTNK